ncbi:MAG: phage shock protein operon transcriptional activator [Halieaceae bacterium]|jgi:psp operon transcriptional activator|nr:phage shock protein operon transcriptional activator [Halieaceae bacterium]
MNAAPTNIIGQSAALAAALDHVSSLAQIDRPVLILGERGTGKELVAERLHFLSSRWSNTLVKVNCGAITETLLESELFGHEAGAFTGASKTHIGRFERADGGTLFLDELGTMSMRLQEKLLRLIEYGEFERVGGQRTINVDVRVIAATNADLRKMADRGEFRWDLLDRLTFDVVDLPPLRRRPEDVEELANHFAVKFCAELGWSFFPGFSEDALNTLHQHDWPGNVRELKNVVERSIYRWGEQEDPVDTIIVDPYPTDMREMASQQGAADKPAATDTETTAVASGNTHETAPAEEALPQDLTSWLQAKEKACLVQSLAINEQHQGRAAERLGLTYDQMRGLMKKHGLRTRRRRS